MSALSMRQEAGIGPASQTVYVTLTRMGQTVAGGRQVTLLTRWPAVLTHVAKEESVKMGYQTEVLHTLVGPIWGTVLLQAGDLVQRILARDGTSYVRPDKPWIVLGRSHNHGLGPLSGQTLLCKEEV